MQINLFYTKLLLYATTFNFHSLCIIYSLIQSFFLPLSSQPLRRSWPSWCNSRTSTMVGMKRGMTGLQTVHFLSPNSIIQQVLKGSRKVLMKVCGQPWQPRPNNWKTCSLLVLFSSSCHKSASNTVHLQLGPCIQYSSLCATFDSTLQVLLVVWCCKAALLTQCHFDLLSISSHSILIFVYLFCYSYWAIYPASRKSKLQFFSF